MTTFYAFNTGEKINPSTGEGSQFFNREEGQVLYVLSTGKTTTRVVSSFGDVTGHPEQVLGRTIEAVWQSAANNDRTTYPILIGYVDAEGNQHGTVPSRKQPHYVMK